MHCLGRYRYVDQGFDRFSDRSARHCCNDGGLQSLFCVWTVLHVLSVETWFPAKLNGVLPIDGTYHVSWSISTEFMLYFMFAVAALLGFQMARAGRLTARVTVGAVIGSYTLIILVLVFKPAVFDALAASLRVPYEILTATEWRRWFFYMSPYFRILEFGTGSCAALAVLYRQELLARFRRQFRLAAAAAAFGLTALHLRGYWPSAITSVLNPIAIRLFDPNIGAWLRPAVDLLSAALFAGIMVNGGASSRLNKLHTMPALLFLGEISYSLYLFHPLAPRFGIVWPDSVFVWNLAAVHLMNFLIFCFFAIVFAYGMYKLVEMPGQCALRNIIRRR